MMLREFGGVLRDSVCQTDKRAAGFCGCQRVLTRRLLVAQVIKTKYKLIAGTNAQAPLRLAPRCQQGPHQDNDIR